MRSTVRAPAASATSTADCTSGGTHPAATDALVHHDVLDPGTHPRRYEEEHEREHAVDSPLGIGGHEEPGGRRRDDLLQLLEREEGWRAGQLREEREERSEQVRIGGRRLRHLKPAGSGISAWRRAPRAAAPLTRRPWRHHATPADEPGRRGRRAARRGGRRRPARPALGPDQGRREGVGCEPPGIPALERVGRQLPADRPAMEHERVQREPAHAEPETVQDRDEPDRLDLDAGLLLDLLHRHLGRRVAGVAPARRVEPGARVGALDEQELAPLVATAAPTATLGVT